MSGGKGILSCNLNVNVDIAVGKVECLNLDLLSEKATCSSPKETTTLSNGMSPCLLNLRRYGKLRLQQRGET